MGADAEWQVLMLQKNIIAILKETQRFSLH
jgi:hypothetical protein